MEKSVKINWSRWVFILGNLIVVIRIVFIAYKAYSSETDVAENVITREVASALLWGVFGNTILILFEINFVFQDKIKESFSIERKLNNLVHIINKNKVLKRELNELIDHFAIIHDTKSGIWNAPKFVQRIYQKRAEQKLEELNDQLEKLKSGEIYFDKSICLQATVDCIQGAKKKIFAVSYPDLFFWSDEGAFYLEENKKLIKSKNVVITRFFIVRNGDEDRSVLEDQIRKVRFIKTLEKQVAVNYEEGVKGRIRVFVTDYRLINFRQIAEGLNHIPDISIYDNVVVSEWLSRAGSDKIDQSKLSFHRSNLELAHRIENYLTRNAKSKAFEVTTIESATEAVENLIAALTNQNKGYSPNGA